MKKYLKYFLRTIELIFVILLVAMFIRGYILGPKISFEQMTPEGALKLPTHVTFFPEDDSRYLVTEKTGKLKYFHNKKLVNVSLDLSDKVYSKGSEEGLLSIVFDPNFKSNRFIYVFYSTAPPVTKSKVTNFLDRYKLNKDNQAILSSRLNILRIDKKGDGHNGGMMLFGPDDMLYISIGYGYRPSPLLQTRKSLKGTILRIDVSNASAKQPYQIPPDNPFVDAKDGSRAEIWAYGLRNLWRFSYDPVSGKFIGGDVGENKREEINWLEKGNNYGWPDKEGELCRLKEGCNEKEYAKPIAAFPRIISRSIVGGYIYRGKAIEHIQGKYVFADFLRGIMTIDPFEDDGILTKPSEYLVYKLPTSTGKRKGETILFSSLAVDSKNELYGVNIEGEVMKFIPTSLWDRIWGFLFTIGNFK